MNNKVLALFLIFSLLFVAAQCGTTTPKDTATTFIGGSNGVEIAFKETAPIAEFQQTDSVPLTVVLKNKGESDLITGAAKVKLFWVNLDSFSIATNTYKGTSGPLKKVSSISPEGSEQEVNFENIKYKLQIPGNEVNYALKAKVCYPYETDTFASLCIRSKLLEKEVGCTLDEGKNAERIKTGDVSSAPIQVTSLTEKTRGSDQVQFAIKIENKGTGKVYTANSDCEALDKDTIKKLDSENKISYEITNPAGVKCGSSETNKGDITLVNNAYTLNCWKTVDSVYEDKLNLKLNYVYISDTTKNIKIFKTI